MCLICDGPTWASSQTVVVEGCSPLLALKVIDGFLSLSKPTSGQRFIRRRRPWACMRVGPSGWARRLPGKAGTAATDWRQAVERGKILREACGVLAITTVATLLRKRAARGFHLQLHVPRVGITLASPFRA